MVNTYMNIYVSVCNVFLHTHKRTVAYTRMCSYVRVC